MKKIFTHLFALFLLSFVTVSNVWAQETTEISLNFSEGACISTSGDYCYSWTSTTDPAITISVGNNKNNLVVNPSSGNFEMHEGASGSTWTFSVTGYRIVSYSFTYKTKQTGNDVTITIGETTYTSSDSKQSLEIASLDSPTASFSLSGSNTGVVVSNLKLEVYKHSSLTALEEGQVYMFENARTARSLRANGTSDVHVKATAASDLAQQWYVTKEGEYYVLRNIACGKYLKGALDNGIAWSMTDDYSATENKFELHTSNYETLNTLKTNGSNGYGYMHDDNNGDNGGYNVVGWLNGNTNTGSHWTITKVDYTSDEITALLEKAPTVAESAAYITSLEALFTDAACVTPELGSLAEAQESNAYKALPAGLKAMVDKVYNEKTEGVALETAWAENNANATKAANDLNWSGKYAKKFRVQMYEPYSIAGDITGFLRMNAHANNDNPTGIYVSESGTVYVMVEGTIKDGASLRLHRAASNFRITNPTGDGYALTTGLNVINITEVNDGGDHLYICYNVDTYNPDGASVEEMFPHKLSEYSPLKIHIEGGHINGFYNACGDFRASAPGAADDLWFQNSGASYDCDADWIYMEERANLAVLPIVSNRQVMLFQLEDTNGSSGTKTLLPESVTVPTVPNYFTEGTPTWGDYGMGCNPETGKINIWMETWDRIMYAELATLGLIQKSEIDKMNQFYPRWNADGSRGEIYNYDAAADGVTYQEFCRGLDYSEYYNHHGVSLGAESGFMSAGWHAANYNINTLSSLVTMAGNCDADGVNNYAVDIWGPAHEIGHQFQDVFNIRGGTEVTNNVFSNAAVWYQGGQTSRYNWGGLDSALSSFNSGLPFIDYNIWSMTQMFYKLWLYYHLAGNNTQFYPRFFEMLRVDPLNAKGATATGTDSMLKIYEKMCDAAGEDLTEFFRAHGFFVLLDNYPKGDYGTTIFTQTQEEVDAAIARVKEKYDKENYAVLLINDLTTEILCHDGVNKRKRFDNTPASEYGTVDNFINGNADAANGGTYTATYNSDGTVTMEGEGGIGFLIFDETGKLVSFSYNSTFALSDEALETIMTGNATFVSVGTDVDAEPVTATIDLSAMQKEILGTLIAKAQLIIDKIDNTYTKIGFYKGAAVADLANVLEYAKEVYAGSSGYEAAYDLLYAEMKKVEANPDPKIPFDPSLTYIITNKAYTAQTMWVNDTLLVRSESGVDQNANAAKWQFKETGVNGVYNIYNMSGRYCPAVVTSTAMKAVNTEQPDTLDALYTLQEMEDGVWAIKLSPAADYRNFHSSWSNVVGWETGNDASRWYLTAVEADPVLADLTDLEVYITKTEALLGEVLGTVTYTRGENITLQTTDEDQPFYIWTNAQCPTEGAIANLVDGATNNYFHTAWKDVTVSSGDHYIAVDLGEDNTLTRFAFSHTTRTADTDHVKSADVYGSDDNVTYKYLGSASGMPQTSGTFWQYEGIMVASHRYLRFNMHANRGYWHMAEFDIMPVTGFTPTVNDTYSGTVTVDAVTAAMEALLNGKSVAFSMSPTTDTVDPVLEALVEAYKNLYAQYEATITARKNTLKQLAADTQTLIDSVGTVEIIATSEVALQTTNPSGDFYVSTNAQSSQEGPIADLVDGSNTTYFHSDYSGSDSSDKLDHCINISLGNNNATDRFKFSYVTRHNAETNYPTAMEIYGSTDGTTYEKISEITEGMPTSTTATYNCSDVIECDKKYAYLRFMITANSSGTDKGGHPFFHMAEFDLVTVGSTTVTIKSSYDGVVSEDLLLSSHLTTSSSTAMSTNDLVTSVPLLDAQIVDQQAAYNRLNEAMNSIENLKKQLEKLLAEAQALYVEVADENNGEVDDYYKTSAITQGYIDELIAQIQVAGSLVEDDATPAKAELETALSALGAICDTINEIKDDNVVARTDLEALIEEMEGLLEQTTVDGAHTAGSLPLQVEDRTNPLYIWTYPRATDDNGKGAIIDETDGVGNTGTFTGTYWESSSEAYSHYVEIDLGVNTVIEDFTIDYTTRYSGAADSRPTGLKFYGSNDKKSYTELFSVTDGLPTTENTKWEMSAPHELAKNYRYIRVAVASTRGGCFNMSDFNLYSHCTATVNDKYSTSDVFDCLPAALREYCDAKEAVGVYLTQTAYDEAKTQLQEQITALRAKVDENITDRGSLETLVTETDELVTEVATINETETAIAMQCADENAPYYLYCNADNSTNADADASDKLGVAALLDGDVSTHLHTTYGGNAQADDLDHYLRLDMGDKKALVSFKFSYTGRDNNVDNAPAKILVEGSNDLNDFDEIAKLEISVPESGTATYASGALGNGKAYRYIRFMVIKTKNNAMYKEHPFFVLSQFSVTACKTIEVAEDYVSPNLPLSTLVTANNEVVDGTTVKEQFFVTQTAYDTALRELQAAKDALELGKVADKSALEELIDATEALKNQLYKHTYTQGTALALQADNAEQAYYLYCNAPESNASSAADNVGVSALIDSDETNYLHTEWTGDQSADGLDHYLRVDLGEDGKLSDFVFSYKSTRDLPRTFVVEGCNTADGEYERIGVYVGANTTNTLITSGLLGNGNEYRYLRFMVIATQSNKKDNSGYHRFFVLNDFDVYPVSNIVATNELKDEYASAIYIYTTTDLVTEVTYGITQAQGVVDDASANQGAVNAKIEALQAVYDKLAEALKYAGVPVEITTDEENPVLYNIISKRADDGSKVLQYCEFDAENPKTVSVSDKVANSSYQAWYFMESANGYYFIKPFNGDGKVLGADNTGNGDTKVWAVAKDEKSYDEWNFVARADGYYNIQAYDGSNYFSNKGGVEFKMGFWSTSPDSDGGSLFKFVKATFENENARFYQLSDFKNTLEYQTADTPEGTTVGAFVNGDAYSTAYTTASNLIATGNTNAVADCYAAYTALRTASEDVERIEPVEGKIYRIYITPGYTASDRVGASMSIDDKGKLCCDTYAESNARFYFTFEYDDDGNLYMKNLHTGTYLDEALNSTDNKNVQVGADAEDIANAKKIAINTLGKSGDAVVVGIVPDGGDMLNCAGKPGNVVAYDNTAVDKASAWVITEVDEASGVMENVVHSVSLGADESGSGKAYSTLYLGYNATIPEGVTASVVTEINEIGQLVMEEVTGNILPAKTAVVLSGENAGGAEFKYADGEPSFSTEDNILKGTSYTKLENCGNSHNIYMLGKKSGRVAFYRAYENRNASGDKVTVEGMGTNHNEGGYVQCNANKAYLMLPEENSQAAAAMFGFHFGGNTTDLESINAVADTYDNVYDLQGRKHTEITEPGMYIVGGKKVLVK